MKIFLHASPRYFNIESSFSRWNRETTGSIRRTRPLKHWLIALYRHLDESLRRYESNSLAIFQCNRWPPRHSVHDLFRLNGTMSRFRGGYRVLCVFPRLPNYFHAFLRNISGRFENRKIREDIGIKYKRKCNLWLFEDLRAMIVENLKIEE